MILSRGFTLTLLFLYPYLSWSQYTKTILPDTANSTWLRIDSLSKKATNKVVILTAKKKKSEINLISLNLDTSDPIAAIAYNTGGISIDDGWIRIFGSGNENFRRDILQWNRNKTLGKAFMLIADDVIGGYYALNLGELGTDTAMVYYFSPKTLKYQPLNLNYLEFLSFCFSGDLDKFYTGMRWKTWRLDVGKLSFDDVFLFLPFLWNKQNLSIEKTIRKVIPAEEKYLLSQQEVRKNRIN